MCFNKTEMNMTDCFSISAYRLFCAIFELCFIICSSNLKIECAMECYNHMTKPHHYHVYNYVVIKCVSER